MDNLFETIEREFAELNPGVQKLLLEIAPIVEKYIVIAHRRGNYLKIK